LEDLKHGLQVFVARPLIAGQVDIAPRRDRSDGLEEHGGDVDGDELDLLVGMVDGHLVHPTKLGERGVEEIEAQTGAGQAADDDRRGDFLVPDLRMTSQQVLDQETVLEEPGEEERLGQHSGVTESSLLSQSAVRGFQTGCMSFRTEAIETGFGARLVRQRAGIQRDDGAGLGQEIEY
jgi:hypothetical protein